MEREERVAKLFAVAIELHPAAREEFLLAECAADAALIREVQTLLLHDAEVEADNFMSQSAFEIEAGRLAHETESRVGETLGRYEILSFISEGGMGEVYLAHDAQLERNVAVKVIKGGLQTKEILRRFRNEQHILANLEHPNIARLLDAGTTPENLPFVVMEYVEGQPIDIYAEERKLSIEERLKLFRTVCAAVTYAHQNLIIHRDIKPSNILVTKDGAPKLLDFGIAKLLDANQATKPTVARAETATLMRVMTPEYASPEQVKGETITTTSDVYSLGVLLYELLTGRRPYRFKSGVPEDVASAICEQEPVRPSHTLEGSATNQKSAIENRKSLRGDLDNIILMALRKEPSRRYASVGEFSEDIRRHIEGLPVKARKDTFSYRASKFVKRNKTAVTAAAIILLTLIGGIIATTWEAYRARNERARAERNFNDVRQLAHTFVFDLNDEIAKGPTQARALLVKRALEYLDDLSKEASDDTALQQEIADGYLKIGDVQGKPYSQNLGDTQGALESYRKARDILERLTTASPSNRDALRDLSAAYESIGHIQSVKGVESSEAIKNIQKSLDIRETLTASDPTNADYQRLLASSHLHLGDAIAPNITNAEYAEKQAPLEEYRKSLTILQPLLARDPENETLRQDVAHNYQRIASSLIVIGEQSNKREYLPESLENFNNALALDEQLFASEPTNAIYRRAVADMYMMRSDPMLLAGDTAEALASCRQALKMFEELAAADPTNAEAQHDVAYVYFRIGNALLKSGDEVGARDNYRREVQILESLLKADPTRTDILANLLNRNLKIGEMSEKLGDTTEAIENFQRCVELAQEIFQSYNVRGSSASRSSIINMNYTVARMYFRLAHAHVTAASKFKRGSIELQKHLREAKEMYQKGLNVIQQMRAENLLPNSFNHSIEGFNSYDSLIEGFKGKIKKCDEALEKSDCYLSLP